MNYFICLPNFLYTSFNCLVAIFNLQKIVEILVFLKITAIFVIKYKYNLYFSPCLKGGNVTSLPSFPFISIYSAHLSLSLSCFSIRVNLCLYLPLLLTLFLPHVVSSYLEKKTQSKFRTFKIVLIAIVWFCLFIVNYKHNYS